jgi:hypothetical protein
MRSQEQIEKLLEQAKFVFIGTVTETGASNLKALKAAADLVLVKIERVAQAPPALTGVVGTTVTVKIPAETMLKSEETKLFFTNGLMFGENLAVEASAIEDLEKSYDETVMDIKNAVANIEREERLERINKAMLILEGRVTKMEESELNQKYPLTFDSPYWVSVTIRISRVIKGKYEGKTIEAFINKGGESEEGAALEIEIGKTGVWLLGREKIFNDLIEFYLIEEPEDFLNSYEYAMLTHPNSS